MGLLAHLNKERRLDMANYERTTPDFTVVEKREITSVTVDTETGMTDVLEKVQLVKEDGSIASSSVQRTTVPTADASDWINEATTLSKKVETQSVNVD